MPVQSSAGAAIARNASYLLLSQVLATALSIVLNAAIGRSLGAADFGVIYLVTAIGNLAFVFIDWGQGMFTIRHVANHPAEAGETMATAVSLWCAGCVVVGALTLGITWLMGYDGRIIGYVALLIPATLPLFVADGFGRLFRGLERMDMEALVSLAGKVLTVACTLPLLWMGGKVAAVIGAEGAAGIGEVIVALVVFSRLRLPPLKPTKRMARVLLVGGTPFMTMLLGITAQASIDAVALSRLSSPESVGWYGAARTIMNALITPAAILGAASFPRLSRAAADAPAFRRELRAAVRPLLGLACLASLGTYLFADVAIGLVYGKEKFGPAVTLLQIFSPILLLFFLDVLLGSGVMVTRPGRLAFTKGIAIAIGTVADILFVPFCQRRFGNGGIGLLFALAACELFMVVSTIALLPRGALDPRLLRDAARALGAAAVAFGVMRLLPRLGLAGIPVCVAVYGLCAIAFGLIERKEVAAAWAAVMRRFSAAEPTAT